MFGKPEAIHKRASRKPYWFGMSRQQAEAIPFWHLVFTLWSILWMGRHSAREERVSIHEGPKGRAPAARSRGSVLQPRQVL
jgi:hypothetical protein